MASIGSGNDLSHVWCQAITWSHASYFSVYVWLISIVYVKDLCRDWTNTMVCFHDEINNLFNLFQCVLHFLSILPVINNITIEVTRGVSCRLPVLKCCLGPTLELSFWALSHVESTIWITCKWLYCLILKVVSLTPALGKTFISLS